MGISEPEDIDCRRRTGTTLSPCWKKTVFFGPALDVWTGRTEQRTSIALTARLYARVREAIARIWKRDDDGCNATRVGFYADSKMLDM